MAKVPTRGGKPVGSKKNPNPTKAQAKAIAKKAAKATTAGSLFHGRDKNNALGKTRAKIVREKLNRREKAKDKSNAASQRRSRNKTRDT